MTAKKARPKLHEEIEDGMSQRDIAAALGMSTAMLSRAIALSEVGHEELSARLARNPRASIDALIRGDVPVPARGRVERAMALVAGMSDAELAEFIDRIAEAFDVASQCSSSQTPTRGVPSP